MKKLYIETSVWNQLEHTDRPEWRETAEQFIKAIKRGLYEPYISDIVVKEISATPDKKTQEKLVAHINEVNPVILNMDEEGEILTEKYMAASFAASDSIRVYNDCSHVAIATTNNITHIVSFNCKHLVNDRRIDEFNAINFQSGYDRVIDITTPHRFILSQE